jgi:hypothetical protein
MTQGLAYKLLEQMCKVQGIRSSRRNTDPFTPRVDFIMDSLMDLGIGFAHDQFGSFVNITAHIKGKSRTSSVVYLAHHDIVNPDSDNCNDNTASVCNLLSLADHFKQNQPEKDVYIVFTDGEEIGGHGSTRLAEQINSNELRFVEYAVNLELTAFGKHLWVDAKNITGKSKLLDLTMTTLPDALHVATPFQDSIILREKGIDSVCFGTINGKDYNRAIDGGMPKAWMVCHSERDGFDQAISEDMDSFVLTLSQLVGDRVKLSLWERMKRKAFFILNG